VAIINNKCKKLQFMHTLVLEWMMARIHRYWQ